MAAVGEAFRQRTMKVLKFAFLSGLVLEFMTAVAIALIAVTLGVRLITGNLPFEEAFLVLLLAPEFYRPLRELGVHRHAGMEGKAAAQRMIEILNIPPPVSQASGNPVRTDGGLTVELSDVGYTYPGSEDPAPLGLDVEAARRRADGTGGPQRRRKEHAGQPPLTLSGAGRGLNNGERRPDERDAG